MTTVMVADMVMILFSSSLFACFGGCFNECFGHYRLVLGSKGAAWGINLAWLDPAIGVLVE